MKRPVRKITTYDIVHRTNQNNQYIKDLIQQAADIIGDIDKDKRLLHCVYCFYRGPRMSGQAITESCCQICEKEMMFGSTAVDILCVECARKHNLCKECGADIELKIRKKPYNFTK